jgi:hypothetical protein
MFSARFDQRFDFPLQLPMGLPVGPLLNHRVLRFGCKSPKNLTHPKISPQNINRHIVFGLDFGRIFVIENECCS